MGGRPPKPTQLKIVQGTARKCRTKNEPKVEALDKIPPIPETLEGKNHKIAQCAWTRIAFELEKMKLLSSADLMALEALCFAYERMIQAEDALADGKGLVTVAESGYSCQRAEVSIASNARKEVREFLAQFGMTPAARTRVSAKQEEPKSVDPMERILNGA